MNKEHSSALNYTRDCLSGPLRFLVRMISHINVGAFRPTLSRDQMFPRPSHWQHLRDQFKAETGLDVTDAAHVVQQGSTYFSRMRRGKKQIAGSGQWSKKTLSPGATW